MLPRPMIMNNSIILYIWIVLTALIASILIINFANASALARVLLVSFVLLFHAITHLFS